ncbi:hypothetical protein [Pelagibacterium montanilacus]|uniref:hypothetical protein n=1 Tax=Pelagibacterium montanilacus TaxID=2185280 RepID=UPI000F8F6A2B|nr:hypothetical protein [Pelagibacterium montanilacus]
MKHRTGASIAGALGVLVCLMVPALAQLGTAVGTLSVTIDGEAYEGETLDVPSEGTSTATVQSFGPVTTLTIQAHDPQSDSIMRNVMAVELSLMGSDASASIMEASVSWWPGGMGEPFYYSEGSGTATDIVIDTLTLEDGAEAIQGSVSGMLCRRDSFFADPDMDDCRMVEGTFDTPLLKAE